MSLFGRVYRTFTFGQSHAQVVGCVIQGFPSGFRVDLDYIQAELNRRRPGQSSITTTRKQKDLVQLMTGVENNITLGCPLMFVVRNQNIKKNDYDRFHNIPRPGHADFSYKMKYGVTASSGGGRSSARQTIGIDVDYKGRIISGALAKQYLKQHYGIDFASWVYQIGHTTLPLHKNNEYIQNKITNTEVEKNSIFKVNNQNQLQENIQIRCPDLETAQKMYKEIKTVKSQGDSIGGIIQSCIYNLPSGLGQPVFDKIQAYLAHAMLSIPATKGFEFGSGFEGTKLKGSQHNDLFQSHHEQIIKLKTNNSGGSLGGVSSGETFHFKVAFKPVSTISKPQKSVDYEGTQTLLQGKGRHDPCVLPRAPAIVDNMAAMAIMDLLLLKNCNSH